LCEHVGVIRLHEGADAKLGDPYIWACTVFNEGGLAVFKGAMAAPPHSAKGAICGALVAAGFVGRRHERRKNGTIRHVEKALAPAAG
jgi:hypothetical protein